MAIDSRLTGPALPGAADGQARDTVDMLKLPYHTTRDEDVYNTISARMKDWFTYMAGYPTASTTTG